MPSQYDGEELDEWGRPRPKRANRLRDLTVGEVSFVDRAANRKRFLLFKAEGEEPMEEDMLRAVLEVELEDEDAVDATLEKADISAKGALAVKGVLRLLNAFKDELPESIMTTLGDLAGYSTPEAKAKPDDYDYQYPPAKSQQEKVRDRRAAAVRSGKLRAALAAVEKGDYSQVTKADFHAALTDLAQAIRQRGETSEQAYSRALSTEEGRQLFGGYNRAPRDPLPEPVAKAAPDADEPQAWHEIMDLAQALIRKSGKRMSQAQAVDAVLQTPEGKTLYRSYCRSKGRDRQR